ncbi:hypothetical protein KFK09_026825 [Dendrobium nobile]|uniref:DCD domain-containing protein n=1 Tax=Dendrobium nobile TaxID=94219 RepID=A0A8T3A9S7_DENNO|nr:hypothetical protein KFK09_026825 [Dendrobium nobile]
MQPRSRFLSPSPSSKFSSVPLYKPVPLFSLPHPTSDRDKEMEISTHKEQSSFRHFSEQLRLETAAFSSLSIGDSIWSDPFIPETGKTLDERRNFLSVAAPEFTPSGLGAQKLAFTNSSLNRIKSNGDEYSSMDGIKDGSFSNKRFGFTNGNGLMKNYYFDKSFGKHVNGKKNNSSNGAAGRKKNGNSNNGLNKNSNHSRDINSNGNGGGVDKRFKTLPASEALPRNEAVGGYIFVCNNDTMQENLERQLFGLPSRYRDSVRAITPGLPLFLYNYSTHQLYGIFEAASFGGTNIDPLAWEDKKKSGESRFPAQVRVVTRKLCEPLEEDSFRPFLHHYDGPKFRLELSIPEALALLDIFEDKYV